MAPDHITDRALSRATLARQHLLERVVMAPDALVRHLVGMQAQEPQSWYITFWSRLRGFDPDATGRLLIDRQLVRITLMRATIHLADAADALRLRRFTQSTIDRFVRGRYRQQIADVDLAELAIATRAATTEPASLAEVVAELSARWPSADPFTLSLASRTVVPLVQVPPRGVWRRAGAVRLTPLDEWIGASIPGSVDLDDIVRRYLAAYGPASPADATLWSGVTHLREIFDRLRPTLRTFRDERGRELFDLPEAPRPDPDTPAPVRLLADFDNVLLSHRDRSRFFGVRERALFTSSAGPYPSPVLIDGRMAGQWHIRPDTSTPTLVLRVADPPSAALQAEIEAEAAALLAFYAPGEGGSVEVVPTAR